VVGAGEAGHLADVADHDGGDHRADPKQPGQAGPGRPDRHRELVFGVAHLRVDAAQIGHELGRELVAGRGDRAARRDRGQQLRGLACGDLLAEAARQQPAAPRAAGTPAGSAAGPGPGAAWGQTRSTAAWSSAATARAAGERSAATATDRASFGSFLPVAPAASSRTRALSLGWTSSTRSPAASSCWASR